MIPYYENLYRKAGIRKTDQLTSATPPLLPTKAVELPRASIFHYVGNGILDAGPDSQDLLYRSYNKQIMIGHVVENGDNLSKPRKLAEPPAQDIRAFRNRNPRFKTMLDLEAATRDDLTLVVYNYAFIPRYYHYSRAIYTEYHKWWNQQAAVWENIAKVAEASPRHQFIRVALPRIIPSLEKLNQAADGGMNQLLLKTFNSAEAFFFIELWKWFGDNRASSLLAKVPVEKMDRINLIFQESGKCFIMNLGLINRWRKPAKVEIPEGDKTSYQGYQPKNVQRYWLRLMISLMKVRTGEETQEKNAAAEATGQAKENQSGTGPTGPVDQPVTGAKPGASSSTGTTVTEVVASGITGCNVASDDEQADPASVNEPEDLVAPADEDIELEKQIDAELAELERINEKVQDLEAPPELQPDVPGTATEGELENGVKTVCERLAPYGLITANEMLRHTKLASSYKTLKAPDGKSTLAEFIQIPPEVLKIEAPSKIKDIPTVLDKTMLKSSLLDFDPRYVKHVMQRDVAGMVMNLQRAGVSITGYEVERDDNVMGASDWYTVRIVPVEGVATSVRFKLPVIDEDGNYTANGVKYRMRKQRGDLPIRKIAPDRVALTSYYGKIFASRSSKKVNNYDEWLRTEIMAAGENPENKVITGLHPADVFDNLFVCPRAYGSIAMSFRTFSVLPPVAEGQPRSPMYHMLFDHTKREETFGAEALKRYERDGMVLVGESINGDFLALDDNAMLYRCSEGKVNQFMHLEAFLGLDSSRAPVNFAELRMAGGVSIPIGLILGYELGLERLMSLLKVTPRRVAVGARKYLEPHEYALEFADETLIFSREDRLASLVLAGFTEYHRAIRNFNVTDYDKRDVYLNTLESNRIGVRYLREIDLMFQLFVDPITRDLLIEMKEPTDFRGLLLRSCELLMNNQHPDELDPAFMRIKGYERMPGAVYSELVRAIRSHNARAGKKNLQLDVPPYAVWQNITRDPSIALVEDINPIKNLKDPEAVTYSGTGGRSSRSMTKHTRAYHPNDMGTISESTKDSSDVAINTYTSADPQFTSLRGMSSRYDLKNADPTSLLSSAALISPAADKDDPKRVNFIGIQHDHGIACSGYSQLMVRTGYEQVIGHRTTDLFCYTARKPGKVISLSETGMVVEYTDGETKGIELGRRFGKAGGLTIPHEVLTGLRIGQSFKEGDTLCYNSGFFEPDVLNPAQMVYKGGVMARVALFESPLTLEDSSAISTKLAGRMTTKSTKIRDIVVKFDQVISNLVKQGDSVESESILCIIEDAVMVNTKLFDQQALDTLRGFDAHQPKAKSKGVVERFEVFYHGDKEDMSESLRALANSADRDLSRRSRSAGKPAYTGSTDDDFRADGNPLVLDTMAIRIYITTDVIAGIGDKGVFGNQMKTVIGEVFDAPIYGDSGQEIDAYFGQKSIGDRIVSSPEFMGTLAMNLEFIGEEAVRLYES